MKEVRKVKSVQMFKRPVQRASQGDRIGMCVTQFDAKLLERGVACAPGYVTTIHGCVIDMGRNISQLFNLRELPDMISAKFLDFLSPFPSCPH